MAEGPKNQIQNLHNQDKIPSISLRVYHRRHRPKLNPNLPEELVIEILKRQPVSSLLRFMSVSKSWYSIITNPSFVSAHLSQQLNPTSKNGVTTLYGVSRKFFLHNVDEPLDNWVEIDSPFRFKSLIVGCCHGVICLFDYWSNNGLNPLILWNPSIRKAFTLPFPIVVEGFRNFTLGFGFDSSSKDYKVVRVSWKWENGETYLRAEVCSLSKGGWRRVRSSVEGGRFEIERRGICVNGVIHWMCKMRVGNNVFLKTILAFKLANEEFDLIVLPNPLSSFVLFSVRLVEDKLAVSCTGDGSYVWVMEEYGVQKSWRKLLNFHLGYNVGSVLGAMVAADGKIVVTTSVGNWISWDPNNQDMKNLVLPVLEPDCVDTFVQSLVFLRFQNQALCCKKLPLEKKESREETHST
ncbi:hypothetical protein SOVF_104000 [Spinacia oleracea]|nr:F-box/kelch-repeat protein At3g23880-like [Spinacia oleracea]XP_021842515.1 F-box/kelch-repeat protein At3g23880-like [Spinacia oleracea]XP_021842516.1 F-box/kelch-repeat protein At3g23880-like [Spinacia oleracea]XP_021842517.1 F-box/kelch-repeat protein At3g23880-like [Spinacia oleracea]KNA14819.1 hypothetical protein SOVF_104000 [Spinacia oleracea]